MDPEILKKELSRIKDELETLAKATSLNVLQGADHKRINDAYFAVAKARWHIGQPLDENEK